MFKKRKFVANPKADKSIIKLNDGYVTPDIYQQQMIDSLLKQYHDNSAIRWPLQQQGPMNQVVTSSASSATFPVSYTGYAGNTGTTYNTYTWNDPAPTLEPVKKKTEEDPAIFDALDTFWDEKRKRESPLPGS
jgi:hypothetical protein